MAMRCSSPLTEQARKMHDSSNSGILPLDVLFDVLVRLPAKELCCLRAICQAWRSLTSDPLFIKAHAAHHRQPLLLATFRDDEAHVHIMDLVGNVLKTIGIPVGHKVLCTHLDLVCVATNWNSCRVLNPATGAVYDLPESPAEEHMYHAHLCKPYTSFAFGRIALLFNLGNFSRVLRMFNRPGFTDLELPQLCEVFTVKGGTGQGHAHWRGKQSRQFFVEMQKANSGVVVNGVVYFLMDALYDAMIISGLGAGIHPDFIFSFDLETEEWREDIQGPISSSFVFDGDFDPQEYFSIWHQLCLAELKGYLVHHQRFCSTMDLWFLTDYETRAWVKEYSIQTESFIPVLEYDVKPLLVLDDGRILIWLGSTGLLLIYDPRTSSFAEVKMRHLAEVGMYTGSLLSLQNGYFRYLEIRFRAVQWTSIAHLDNLIFYEFRKIAAEFAIKDICGLSYFLSIEANKLSGDELMLAQINEKRYLIDLPHRTDIRLSEAILDYCWCWCATILDDDRVR
uniref:F-box domain-containing protein n=1 Tax=Oryza rufipogon TaxID=4529 RepID=A0A0E0Q593_ORYRU